MCLADAQNFNLARTFDAVFAGELIEHLDDFNGFLCSARRHLTPADASCSQPRMCDISATSSTVGTATGKCIPNTPVGSAKILSDTSGEECFSSCRDLLHRSHQPECGPQKAAFAAGRLSAPRLALDTIIAVGIVE